ncbi:ABC transporter substrate-binding protein [Georgenia sp. EYE_87]|uniref:ABC transporter substrate-binding protein n=1 Tax=Georgenia sp. EYE_87 TaxID=2853448 RepID=UPI002003FD85|nr:ABC transporter substrate-binding protein [Georgenia sp. EYE_87]MCK6211086.1 ABC transporter substrate-binding protein [Georgenia sp. EYE_87]
MKSARTILGGLALALTLAACGSSAGTDDPTAAEGGSADGPRSIKVGVLPIAASAAIDVGVEQGFFADHGLDVELVTGQGGGATLPAVSTGELAFAVGNPISVLIAETQGLEMKVVSGYSESLGEGHDTTAIVVPEGSDIRSAADLPGKKVAVNTLKAGGDMNGKEAVLKAGGDPEAVEFIEVPFQDSLPQLDSGNVDAAWLVEPFLSMALTDGHRVVSYLYQEAIPGGQPTMIAYTSARYAAENPEIVADFQAALTQSLDHVQADPDALRAVLPEFMGMPEEVASMIPLDRFEAELNRDAMEAIAELMARHGLSDERPDVAAVLLDD